MATDYYLAKSFLPELKNHLQISAPRLPPPFIRALSVQPEAVFRLCVVICDSDIHAWPAL